MKQFFITATKEMPIKELLANHLPSDSIPEEVILSGGVWKERKRLTNPDYIIFPQETLKVHLCKAQTRTYTLPEPHIIFENNDLLVVYKPVDLNVHAVPTSTLYNLTYGVNEYLKKKGLSFEANPITRLDRPVEGLVIFAKNKNSERRLFTHGKNRKIHKWYMAALEKRDSVSTSSTSCMRIRDLISNNGSRTLHDPEGKHADSLFIRTQRMDHADIYSVFIFTGRRHQIRFHAAHYLAPILGDAYYGSTSEMPPDEIALICRGYNIPYGKTTLKIRLPNEFLQRFYLRINPEKKTTP